MTDTTKVALIDLDGTMADYDSAMRAAMETLRAPGEPPVANRYEEKEPPHLEARRKLIQKIPGFWRNLRRHPLGFEILQELRDFGFKLEVLTKGPAGSPAAWGEKFEWVKNHIPDADVTVTQDKSRTYGRVLCDDWEPYFLPWLEHRPRGLVVCVAQPWNEKYRHAVHLNLFRYDGTNRSELRRRLAIAWEREAK